MLLPPGMTPKDVFKLRRANPARFASLSPEKHLSQLQAWHLEEEGKGTPKLNPQSRPNPNPQPRPNFATPDPNRPDQ